MNSRNITPGGRDTSVSTAAIIAGTGLLVMAILAPIANFSILQRPELADDADIAEAIRLMKLLNKTGAEVMKEYNTKGATDITGFGLAGHALKMAMASKVSIKINMGKVPLIGNVYHLIDDGCIPGASFRNLEFVEEYLLSAPDLDYNLKMIAMDAQTPGGLLMSVSTKIIETVLSDLHKTGLTSSSVIGEVTEFKMKHLNLVS